MNNLDSISPQTGCVSNGDQKSEPVIEIGWIIAGHLDDVDDRAVQQARDLALELAERMLPAFCWRMPLLHRDELVSGPLEESVVLLDHGVVERNIRHWDFSLMVTDADLVSHYKPDAIAAMSRSLEGAVISTCRIDPLAMSDTAAQRERVEKIACRIAVVVMHALGHWTGIGHSDDAANYMFEFETVKDLDQADAFDGSQLDALNRALRRVADQRLEEHPQMKAAGAVRFYLRSAWLNREAIINGILEARPWEFPYRLSRLTGAAVSTLLVLLITAEAWELGMSQSPGFVSGLSAGSILFATGFILRRQRLFARRERRQLSEQNVTTNVATFSIVFVGIITTYLLLFVLSMCMSWFLFSDELIHNWAPSTHGALHLWHYTTLAAFVASLGICIGSLGASFEQQNFIRHVTFVDQEI